MLNWMEVLEWGEGELDDLRFVGYSYLKQGKYEIALAFFEALVVLTQTNAYDLQTLGALHLEKGSDLMALGYIERSLKIEPHYLPARLNKAKALFSLGYVRQGNREAQELARSADATVAQQAEALLLAYSSSIPRD